MATCLPTRIFQFTVRVTVYSLKVCSLQVHLLSVHSLQFTASKSPPEQLIVERRSLSPGPVVSELRDVGVEGAEGVSSYQER